MMAKEKPESVYLQREDCTEKEVNTLISQGYVPWKVTPKLELVQGRLGINSFNTKLIYHFIRKKGEE